MKNSLYCIVVILVLGARILPLTQAGTLTQNFDDFNATDPPNAPPNVTTNGWTINDIHITSIIFPARSGANPAFFPDEGFSGVSGTNSYVETPLLGNGVGNVSFYLQNYTAANGAGPFEMEVRISTNEVDWTTVQAFTNTTDTWKQYSLDVDTYESTRVRFFRGNATMSDLSWLGIDDISVFPPPASVSIESHGINPAYPRADETTAFWADLEVLGGASNLVAQVNWASASASGSFQLPFEAGTGLYEAALPVGLPVLELINYTIVVTFEGFEAQSPQSDTGSFFLRQPLPTSTNTFTSLQVAGGLSQSLSLLATDFWSGLLPTSGFGSTDIHFESVNGGTLRWSDPAPPRSVLPINSTLTEGATEDIALDGAEAGWVLFTVNEATAAYSIEPAQFQDFESSAWASFSGTQTIENWSVTRGQTTTASALVLAGRSFQFQNSSDLRSIVSPLLPNGAGSVQFQYRNTLTNGLTAAAFEIQTAAEASGPWTTVQTVTGIITPDYLFHRHVIDDFAVKYVRIRATGPAAAQLLLDHIAVSTLEPPANVTIVNYGITPASPQAGDTVVFATTLDPTAPVTSLAASLHWNVSGGATGTLALAYDAGTDTYRGTLPSDFPPLTNIDYTLDVTFTGAHASFFSPKTATGNFYYRVPAPESPYTGIQIKGELALPLDLVSDNFWIGVTNVGVLTNTDVFFETVSTTTNRWSDPDQTAFALPLFGPLEQDFGTDIRIGSTEAGWLLFSYDETNNLYNIQQATYQSFNDWAGASTYGNYTIGGWLLTRGRATDETALAFDGYSIQFQLTADERSLTSPALTEGIGTIMLRYRNTDTTLLNPATFHVQVRAGAGAWVTIETVDNIRTPDYEFIRIAVDQADLTQIRILVPSGTATAQLLLDDVIITRPGPTVTISDLEHIPLNPTIEQTVDVNVKIDTSLGASVTSATLHFRAGTNANTPYDPIAMTNTVGNTWTTTIPRGQTGTMQYYVEIIYFNPASGAFQSVRDPLDLTGQPNAYTNTDAKLDTQNFDDFNATAPPATPPNVTTNGWTINDIHVTSIIFPALSGANPAFFPDQNFSGVSGENSYIETPLLSNGLGEVSFYLRNYMAAGGAGPFEMQILTSTDEFTWLPLKTITNTTDSWTQYTISFDTYDPVRIRFLRDNATMNDVSWLAIDDIQLTYPPARVTASNFALHPAYPSAGNPVTVQATITSIPGFHTAFNIAGILEYRVKPNLGSWGVWQQAPMSRYDSNFFGTIPGYPDLAEIEYRFRADFKGYNDGAPGSNQSPTTFTSENFQYRIRSYAAAYERVGVSINGEDGPDFLQQGNGEWEGFVRFITPTSNPSFLLTGYGFYDGNTVSSGLTTIWGDNSQTSDRTPLFGTAIAGQAPITIPGENLVGQYIIRFDENTGVYTVQLAAFQDFENWPADSQYFGESYSAAVIAQVVQDFNHWTLSDKKIRTDNFVAGWNLADVKPYPGNWAIDSDSEVSGSNVDFTIRRGGILVDQLVSQAALLIPGGYVRNISAWKEDAGTFAVDLRAARPNEVLPATYSGVSSNSIRITVDMKTLDIPTNATLDSVGYTYKSIVANYLDDDNFYEARIAQTGTGSRRMELWSRKGGVETRRSNSGNLSPGGSITRDDTFSLVLYRVNAGEVRMRMYQGSTGRGNQWTDGAALAPSSTFGVNSFDASASVNSVEAHANTNNTTAFDATSPLLFTETFTSEPTGWNGRGIWQRNAANNRYERPGYTGAPITARVEHSLSADSGYTALATFTNITHSYYKRYSVNVRRPEDGFVRVHYFSANPAGDYLLVDNVYRDGWRAKTVTDNGWTGTNVWVDNIGNESRGIEMRNTRAIGGAPQSIASPTLAGGAAVVTLQYRAAPDATGPVSFVIERQREGFSTWNQLAAVTNANASDWISYSHGITDRPSALDIRRIRIRNTTAGHDDGLRLDNINITAPPPINPSTWWGYNMLVTDTRPSGISDPPNPWLFPQLNNEFGAFLNNSYTDQTGGATNDQAYPFIQSAKMPDGIGEIRFRYRAWDDTPSTVQIVSSTDRLTPQAQWTVLDTLDVTDTNWQEYRKFLFDRDNTYVAFRLNPTVGTGRVALENILITAPMAAGLSMQNIRTIPAIPRYFEDVHVEVDVTDLFLNPSNIVLKLEYQVGSNNWAQYQSPTEREMEWIAANGATNTYRTKVGNYIPAPNLIDEVVQFRVFATFDGFFANQSSPQIYRNFTPPTHYWPIDLNANQTNQTPYYFAFATLPGQIWINEFNVVGAAFLPDDPVKQYIEIAGIANAPIGNWKVEVINPNFTTNVSYQLAPHTTLPNTNGFGFYVLGNTNTAERHMDLTIPIPESGGIQLARPMGIIDHRISYDSFGAIEGYDMSVTDNSFTYAGDDNQLFESSPIYLTGSGSNLTDFTWNQSEGLSSDHSHIGSVNEGQVLIPWPVDLPTQVTVAITQFAPIVGDRFSAQIETNAENLIPTPLYTTNLLASPITWLDAPNAAYTRDGTTYTVSFDRVEAPKVFYRIDVVEE